MLEYDFFPLFRKNYSTIDHDKTGLSMTGTAVSVMAQPAVLTRLRVASTTGKAGKAMEASISPKHQERRGPCGPPEASAAGRA
jgi:hypothetical protein